MMDLGYGNAREGRSTSFAIDLWIKTYQNAPKNQIGPKYELGLFFVEFSNFFKKNFVGVVNSNPWQPKALIPL